MGKPMPNRVRRAILPLLPALALLALPATASAQPATPLTLEAVATTLNNMGYETTKDAAGKDYSITVHGNYDLTVHFIMSAPGGELYAYIFLQRYTQEQLEKLNMTALLQANDAGPCYFTLGRTAETTSLYVQRGLPSSAVTPVSLRSTLESLQKITYANERYWDTKQWKL